MLMDLYLYLKVSYFILLACTSHLWGDYWLG